MGRHLTLGGFVPEIGNKNPTTLWMCLNMKYTVPTRKCQFRKGNMWLTHGLRSAYFSGNHRQSQMWYVDEFITETAAHMEWDLHTDTEGVSATTDLPWCVSHSWSHGQGQSWQGQIWQEQVGRAQQLGIIWHQSSSRRFDEVWGLPCFFDWLWTRQGERQAKLQTRGLEMVLPRVERSPWRAGRLNASW